MPALCQIAVKTSCVISTFKPAWFKAAATETASACPIACNLIEPVPVVCISPGLTSEDVQSVTPAKI